MLANTESGEAQKGEGTLENIQSNTVITGEDIKVQKDKKTFKPHNFYNKHHPITQALTPNPPNPMCDITVFEHVSRQVREV